MMMKIKMIKTICTVSLIYHSNIINEKEGEVLNSNLSIKGKEPDKKEIKIINRNSMDKIE